MNFEDAPGYYGSVQGEIRKARAARDFTVARIIIDAMDSMARHVAGIVTLDALLLESETGFRRARPADASTIVSIVNSTVSGGDRTNLREILELLAVPQSLFLLRLHDGAVAGCAYLRKNGDTACLGMLAVRPALQGLGLAKKIVEEAERIALEEFQCKRVVIGLIAATNHTGALTLKTESN